MEARIRIERVEKNGVTVAVVTEGAAITDAASAMEIATTVRYETGCSRIAIDKNWYAVISLFSVPGWQGRFCRSS